MKRVKDIYITTKSHPDFDGIASIIAYAELKSRWDPERRYVPVVNGRLDLITQKMLSAFSINIPQYVNNFQLRVEDIISPNIHKANRNQPITEVFKQMIKNDLRVVPIEDDNGKFYGTLGILDIAKKSISSIIPDIFRRIKTSISLIKQAVEGVALNEVDPDESFVATVMIGTVDVAEFMNIIQNFDPENVIIILGNREDLQEKAIDFGVRCIILSNGFTLRGDLVEKAKANGVSVILSDYDAFATAGLVEWSVPVDTICDKNAAYVYPTEFIDDIKDKVFTSTNRATIVIDRMGRILGIITRTDLIRYTKRRVILIKNVSLSTAPTGILHCEILEVIDNTISLDIVKGTLHTRYRIEPWHSTAAIIADEYKKLDSDMSEESAYLLLSAILLSTNYMDPEHTLPEEESLIKYISSKRGIDITELIGRLINMTNS